jgi:hypothetical protein
MRGRTEVLGEEPVPVLLCPLKFPNNLEKIVIYIFFLKKEI